MTMAMMITSSPEDLSNLTTTINIINFVYNMLNESQDYIESNNTKVYRSEIENIADYFTGMHYVLTNPGMTEQELNDYEQVSEA